MVDLEFETAFKDVLEKIKDRRKELGLTQGQLGERMGKPQSAIARFESGGVKDPGVSMLFHVCKALKVRPGDVLDKAFFESHLATGEGFDVDFDVNWFANELGKLPDGKRQRVQRVISEIVSLV